MQQRVRDLAGRYSHWRRVRGDGNCYYRAVMFGLVERSLADPKVMQVLVGLLEKVDMSGELT